MQTLKNGIRQKILFFGAQGSLLEYFNVKFADKATEQVKTCSKNNK